MPLSQPAIVLQLFFELGESRIYASLSHCIYTGNMPTPQEYC